MFIESLEDRRLLSATVLHHAVHAHKVHHATAKHAALKHHAHHTKKTTATAVAAALVTATSTTSTSATSTGTTSTGSSIPSLGWDGSDGNFGQTITFSQAPLAVQTGLTKLAAADSLAAPTASQTVYLGNRDGIESYTLDYSSTGTVSRITVDVAGNAVTEPTEGTTTWGTLSGTGTGSDAAATTEISAIATALGLTAPTAATTVATSTPTTGPVIYTLRLSSASTTSDDGDGKTISVDADGVPVGNGQLPFSVFPAPIQNGFNNHLPTGAATLTAASTQPVDIRTLNGVTTYSTSFTTTGVTTIVTINAAGDLTALPSESTADFSSIPLAAQTELQTLATADGSTTTISGSQTINVYNEGNGITLYSLTLSVPDSSGSTQTYSITITVDGSGNPTVLPDRHGGGECDGGDNGPGRDGGGDGPGRRHGGGDWGGFGG